MISVLSVELDGNSSSCRRGGGGGFRINVTTERSRPGLLVSAMEGLGGAGCWGRWPSEVSPTSGQADDFGSRAVSVTRRDFRTMGLTGTLILLMLREFCCARMVLRGGASLRCRRHRWLYSGDEGSRGPEARCAGREHRVRGQQRHGRDVRRGATRPEQDPRLLRRQAVLNVVDHTALEKTEFRDTLPEKEPLLRAPSFAES
jgi:hypothetical protein